MDSTRPSKSSGPQTKLTSGGWCVSLLNFNRRISSAHVSADLLELPGRNWSFASCAAVDFSAAVPPLFTALTMPVSDVLCRSVMVSK